MNGIAWRDGLRTFKLMYPVYLTLGAVFFALGVVSGQYSIVSGLAAIPNKSAEVEAFLDLMFGTVVVGAIFSFGICLALLISVSHGVIELKQAQLFAFRVLGFKRLALAKYLVVSTLPLFIALGVPLYSFGVGVSPFMLRFMAGITGLVLPNNWEFTGIFSRSVFFILGTVILTLLLFIIHLRRIGNRSPSAVSGQSYRKITTWIFGVGGVVIYGTAFIPFTMVILKGNNALGGDIRNVINHALLASVLALIGMFFLLPVLLRGILQIIAQIFSSKVNTRLVARSLLFHTKFIARLQYPLLSAAGLWCSLAGFAVIFGPTADAIYQVDTSKTSVGEMFSLFMTPLMLGLFACIALIPAFVNRRLGELVALRLQGFNETAFYKQAFISGGIFFLALTCALFLILLPGSLMLTSGLLSYSSGLYGLSRALKTLAIVLGGLAIYALAFALIQLIYQPRPATTLKVLREK